MGTWPRRRILRPRAHRLVGRPLPRRRRSAHCLRRRLRRRRHLKPAHRNRLGEGARLLVHAAQAVSFILIATPPPWAARPPPRAAAPTRYGPRAGGFEPMVAAAS